VGQDNIIELNGKRYDAATGALLGESRIKAVPAARTHQSHHGRTIDGFRRTPKVAQSAPAIITPTKQTATPLAQKTVKPGAGKRMDIKRAPKTVKPHHPERSKTLMRHVVRKPKTAMKPAIKTTAPTEMMARPTSTLAKPLEKKLSVTQVDPVRLARAKHVAKSQHIRRFNQVRQSNPTALAIAARTTQSAPATTHRTATQTRTVSHSIALAKAKQELTTKQQHIDIFDYRRISGLPQYAGHYIAGSFHACRLPG
jgi:hypothetical protein